MVVGGPRARFPHKHDQTSVLAGSSGKEETVWTDDKASVELLVLACSPLPALGDSQVRLALGELEGTFE